MTYLIIIISALCVVFLLYLYLIFPSFEKKEEINEFVKYYYAHRGFHNNESNAPENSLESFKLAVQSGYGIELDIQLTKDNQVVVFHDESLKRMCNNDGIITKMTYDELKEFKLLNSNEHIPLLSEVLDIVGGKVPLVIEFKQYKVNTNLCIFTNVLLLDYKGLYCMKSFQPVLVKWYRKYRKDILRGQLACKVKSKFKISYFMLEHLLINFISRPHFISYDHNNKKNLSRRICRNLFKNFSSAWTITSQEELDNSINDFDIFMFEGFKPK